MHPMNRRQFARTAALGSLSLVPALNSVRTTAAAAARRRQSRRVTKVVTKTFANQAMLRFEDLAPANPYPSTIVVSGFPKGQLLDVNLTLNGFTHGRPFDAAMMLVSPSGKGAILLHNVGGNSQVIGLTVTLDDQATASMPTVPDIQLTTGSFKPTVAGSIANVFPLPAPQGVTATTLSTFIGDNPNGGWQLYAVDDGFTLTGSLLVGWSLTIKARVTVRRKRRPRTRR
jgi:hypothetical protein